MIEKKAVRLLGVGKSEWPECDDGQDNITCLGFGVAVLEEAEKDIEAIYRYIRKSGNKKAATDMVINIREACDSLSENPERGHIPNELSQIGHFEYR